MAFAVCRVQSLLNSSIITETNERVCRTSQNMDLSELTKDSVIINKFIFDENNHLIEDGDSILCEVTKETGSISTTMVEKTSILEAGYEIPVRSTPRICVNEDKEWSEDATRLLLNKYTIYLEDVGPMKKFRNKKAMWLQIANDLEESLGIKKTFIQCENRYKTVLKRKRTYDKNNSSSGSKRIKVCFENELRNIAAIDDSLQPEVLQSSNKIIINNKEQESSIKDSTDPKRNKSGIAKTLLLIHQEKEKNKQKRHEEKMNLLQKYLENGNIV